MLFFSVIGAIRLMGFICEELVGVYLLSPQAKLSKGVYCPNLQNLHYSYITAPLMVVNQPTLTALNMERLRGNFAKSPTLKGHIISVQ